ncbi:MAG: hypothetical protein U0893_20600 [Chloroflexota bacterium]
MSASANGAVAAATGHVNDIVLRPTATTAQSSSRLDVTPVTSIDSVLIVAVAVVVIVILVVFVRSRRRRN